MMSLMLFCGFFWVMVLVRFTCPCSILTELLDLEVQLGIFYILIGYIFFSFFFKIVIFCAYSSTSDEKAIRDRLILVPGLG